MMAEQHQAMSRVIVLPVVPDVRGRRPGVIERHDPRGDEGAVVAVRDDEDAEDRKDEVKRAHETRSVSK
jgi:hypothetical protein